MRKNDVGANDAAVIYGCFSSSNIVPTFSHFSQAVFLPPAAWSYFYLFQVRFTINNFPSNGTRPQARFARAHVTGDDLPRPPASRGRREWKCGWGVWGQESGSSHLAFEAPQRLYLCTLVTTMATVTKTNRALCDLGSCGRRH